MSALVIQIQDEQLTALAARARSALDVAGQADMASAGARAIKRLLVDHFTDLEAERHREEGEGFYADAARAVEDPQVTGGSAAIIIDKIGLAQRLLGGTIKAGANISSKTGLPTKYIAIPNPGTEAVGKTPADFPNLEFFKTKRGGGLKVPGAVASLVGHLLTGKNKGKSKSVGEIVGEVVLFWLVPEVDQAPDPTVLPADEEMDETAYEAMDQYLARRLATH